jgi:hypothetical protein
MDPPNDQSPPTSSYTTITTPLLHLILLLSILLITTYLTIRSSSRPGGILHGARINHFHTRVNPVSSKQDIADDNNDDDAPYGTPGIFDDQSLLALRTELSGQDTTDNGDSDGDGDGDGDDSIPSGTGIFDKPTPSL